MGTFNPPLSFARPHLPRFSSTIGKFKPSWEAASLTKGSLSSQYEAAICRALGVKHAVAVASGTTGLMMALRALNVDGECLVPSFTFTATVTALLWNNLKPVFVDCHPRRFTLDPQALSRALTKRTSLVVATYIFGNPPPIRELKAFCARHRLPLVLDAAHAFGTTYSGKPAGTHGTLEVFSTSATKLLCTGEGGIIATGDSTLARILLSLREYGHGENYETSRLGLNGRLTEFQSLLGLEGLKLLSEHAQRRNQLALAYQKAFHGLPVSFQEIEPRSRSSYKDFALLLEGKWASKRDRVADELLREGIPTRKYFAPPIHRQKFFRDSERKMLSLPVTEDLCRRILCLPIFYDLTEQQIEKIAKVMRRILKG